MTVQANSEFEVQGNIVDLEGGEIFPGTVRVRDGAITGIERGAENVTGFIIPGFIDAHVHVESSMLIPSEFAKLAVRHGTVATVSDPHEIGNVLGVQGVDYMIENASTVPFKFFFGAPSCVPATNEQFETAGAVIDAEAVSALLDRPEIRYLSEMMNFPGVLQGDSEVLAKLRAAKKAGKVIDGHAPGLRGEQARAYAESGISTDHECVSLEEAREKAEFGMKISIREGSAARNFEALIPILNEFPEQVMFCSDDKHPDELLRHHINDLARRAVEKGFDPITVLRAACVTPVQHYGLPVGLLRSGDPADFIVVEDLKHFKVLATYIDGRKVAESGTTLFEADTPKAVNNFSCQPISPESLEIFAERGDIRVIEAHDGQLITSEAHEEATIRAGLVVSDSSSDILKLVVVNRYAKAQPAVAFVKNFGLKRGALASSVAHDCHNIIAVGVTDEEIARAVNSVIASKGGISLVDKQIAEVLPLPVAGLMSLEDGETVGKLYEKLDKQAKQMGSTLRAPYMTLSFLALLVIPQLKLSDRGLFDGETFSFVSLFP